MLQFIQERLMLRRLSPETGEQIKAIEADTRHSRLSVEAERSIGSFDPTVETPMGTGHECRN
jgi:hypothetical protein